MTVRIEQRATGHLAVEVAEVFDQPDASTIHDALACAGPNFGATIDFHRARRCEALAVALLSREIIARRGRIVVLGMGLHERRLLGYFGVSEHDFTPPVPSLPPEAPPTEAFDVATRGGLR